MGVVVSAGIVGVLAVVLVEDALCGVVEDVHGGGSSCGGWGVQCRLVARRRCAVGCSVLAVLVVVVRLSGFSVAFSSRGV